MSTSLTVLYNCGKYYLEEFPAYSVTQAETVQPSLCGYPFLHNYHNNTSLTHWLRGTSKDRQSQQKCQHTAVLFKFLKIFFSFYFSFSFIFIFKFPFHSMSIYRARLRNTSNRVSSEQIRLQVPHTLFCDKTVAHCKLQLSLS